jgi:hypothetical protein
MMLMRMRIILVCAFTVALVGAQTPSADNPLFCVNSLTLPTLGGFAARAGTSGTVRAKILIGEKGKLTRLDLDGKNSALNAEVEVAMNLSQFAEQCKNQTIALVFQFTLKDPPTDYIVPPVVRFLPPSRFELIFRRVKPIIDPAPNPTTRSKTDAKEPER